MFNIIIIGLMLLALLLTLIAFYLDHAYSQFLVTDKNEHIQELDVNSELMELWIESLS